MGDQVFVEMGDQVSQKWKIKFRRNGRSSWVEMKMLLLPSHSNPRTVRLSHHTCCMVSHHHVFLFYQLLTTLLFLVGLAQLFKADWALQQVPKSTHQVHPLLNQQNTIHQLYFCSFKKGPIFLIFLKTKIFELFKWKIYEDL